jgi:poly [ADP-ribose] polymerase 2/3/4
MAKVIKEANFKHTIVDSLKRTTLNFTDILNNNNKFYQIEIVKASDNNFWLYTTYGRVGGTKAKEYRSCSDQSDAESEANKIIKAKTKKGYVEVSLVKSDVGSDAAQAKIEKVSATTEQLKKAGITVKEEPAVVSKLHTEVQDLVRTWFGVTQEFVDLNLDTSKCSLGQLSILQITKGKDLLDEARKIVHMKKPDEQELNKLTNSYYSNIPHNFGYTRIDANALRLDSDTKIDKAFDMLDVLNQAKDVEAVISKKSAVDSQYATLKADLEFIDSSEPTWKWIDAMLNGTRASNHSGLGKLKTHKIFRLNRHGEDKNWLGTSEKIAKECGKYDPSPVYSKLLGQREDIPKELQSLYKNANILPGWHGTRRANMIGITTKGLLIRPSGVIHAGSMYGDGIYWAVHSTKSINYCDVKGSYWAQGSNKTAYLFLADVAFGNQKIAAGSHMYTRNNIKPNHSVWARSGGSSGLYNDELITYTASGTEQQHRIRYIIEFETQVK